METVTVLSRWVQTLLLGLFLDFPVQNSIQVSTPLLMFSIHSGDLILQVVHYHFQLFNLPLQGGYFRIIVVDLDG